MIQVNNTHYLHYVFHNSLFEEATIINLYSLLIDVLLSRHIVGQLLSETARLKQLMGLHQVSTERETERERQTDRERKTESERGRHRE